MPDFCPGGKGHRFKIEAAAVGALFLWCERCGELRNIVIDEAGSVAS